MIASVSENDAGRKGADRNPPQSRAATGEKRAFSLADSSLINRLLACSDLPSPPNVAVRIIALGQDPATNLNDVAAAVQTDPALSAKVLRMANSPLYARRRKISNLRQALMLFGLNGTLTLALSFSLVNSLRASVGKGLDYALFWRRSIGAAAAAQALSQHLRIDNREEAFLAGLLQDIGMLALDKAYQDLYSGLRSRQQSHDRLVAHEQAELGVDHAEVGAWLLSTWNLPENICYATGSSHRSSYLEVPENSAGLADCVNIGALLADVWLRPDHDQAVEEVAERAMRLRGIDAEQLAELMPAVQGALQEASALFDVDLGDIELMERTASQAKEVLLMRQLVSIQETAILRQQSEELSSRTRVLEEQVHHDILTGVFNRRYLEQLLESEFTAANSHSWPLAIAFVDIDDFKRVNDTHGHPDGDAVLRAIAQLLEQICRLGDAIGRYGGDEFLLVLPGTDLAGAEVVCQRAVESCRNLRHRLSSDESLEVTLSIGLAVHGEPVSFDNLKYMLRAADQALYQAKARGRDRVVVYQDESI